jgi:hypothetical protein
VIQHKISNNYEVSSKLQISNYGIILGSSESPNLLLTRHNTLRPCLWSGLMAQSGFRMSCSSSELAGLMPCSPRMTRFPSCTSRSSGRTRRWQGLSFKGGPNMPTRRFCDGPRILDIAQQIPSDNPAWIALISDEVTQLEGIAVASWFSLGTVRDLACWLDFGRGGIIPSNRTSVMVPCFTAICTAPILVSGVAVK